MTAALARAVMALAAGCLGDRRRDWALAMAAEFEAASEDGKPLRFALGCLMAALRELPAHREGRVAIASHALAYLLILPTAALIVSIVLADFPYSYLGRASPYGLGAIGEENALLGEANRSAVPSLAALMVFLAASHVRMAWLLLERDWVRVATVGTMTAAATVTLTLFTAVAFVSYGQALTQATALTIELASIAALARWHARSLGPRPDVLTWRY